MIYPLVTADQMSDTYSGRFEWICFKPTCRRESGKGRDGLILYEIHSMESREYQVIKDNLKDLVGRIKGLRPSPNYDYDLSLIPGLKAYWQENPDQQQQWQKIFAIGLGAAALVGLAIFIIPSAAVGGLTVGGAAVATGTGLASGGTFRPIV